MIQEVLKGIYQIKVPLPGNPLAVLNSYLIKGNPRSLLVDTGFNIPACKCSQLQAMRMLDIKWENVDFFITHAHADHYGLVKELCYDDSKIYCSKIDDDLIKAIRTNRYWKERREYFTRNGFPVEKIVFKDMGKPFANSNNMINIIDNDVIDVGDFRLTCIETSGHSPGHMCLYEPHYKLLFSGDHILGQITSNITSWNEDIDSLGDYLSSLDKVDAMDVRAVLPGHREIIADCHQRIMELKQHHENRLHEIMSILETGKMHAYQIASLMHWEMAGQAWDQVSHYQQWFATGETIAHLEHLIHRGNIKKSREAGRVIYGLSDDLAD